MRALRAIRNRLVLIRRSYALCPTRQDRQTFQRCQRAPAQAQPVQIRVRQVTVPLWCRPGTTDAATLWSVFGERFHLPHVPLPAAAIILDLGANAGYTMVDFALRYPAARVVGVELDRDNAELARRNVAPFGERCTVVHAAIAPRDGPVRYAGDEAWAYHVAAGTTAAPGVAGERTAPGRTVASVLADQGMDRVDFLKVDIEGGETELLETGQPWLPRVAALSLETHSAGARRDCRAALERAGFRVVAHPRHGGGLLAHR